MIKTLSKAQKMEREKFRIPRSVQDAIPIHRIFADGIFQVGNQYSKTWSFTDINYAIASKEDKTSMFLDYSELLNALDSGASAKITIYNRRINKAEFERSVLLPKYICVWMWAVRKSRLRLWIKEEIFWRLSAISRQWPARTGKRCLKTLVGFLAVSARKMLFPLKLILRFPDRLTIKTASAFYKGWTNTMHCTAAICTEHSPKSAACWSKKFNSSMMQRPLRWGKWPLVRRRKPGELCL